MRRKVFLKIWHRYLFFRLAYAFFFFLFCLFFLYVALDLAAHGSHFFSSKEVGYDKIFIYYLKTFVRHLDLFLPFTFLLASLKVLLDLNAHRELVVLQMAGLSKKKLLLPFFCFALLLAGGGLAKGEWGAFPLEDGKHFAKKKKGKKEHLFHIVLDDDSELVYQAFDREEKTVFDLFWIRQGKDMWHMKYLFLDAQQPTGQFVDHFQRNPEGLFEKVESFDKRVFAELSFHEKTPWERLIPYEDRPMSHLFRQSLRMTPEHKGVLSHFLYKLALPFLPLFILCALGPIALEERRSVPSFLIFTLSIAAFVGLMTILDGMLILGENGVIPPGVAIGAPMGLVGTWSVLRFVRSM